MMVILVKELYSIKNVKPFIAIDISLLLINWY